MSIFYDGHTDKEILKLVEPTGRDEPTRQVRPTNARRLKAFLTKCGFTIVECSQGYHYATAFVKTKSGKLYYFSSGSDDGCTPGLELLGRTAKDTKDYTGGRNQWFTRVSEVKELAES